jgi:hypothetical protein
MKNNRMRTIDRLKENISSGSGCSIAFLKVLKSELYKFLNKYMLAESIDFDVKECDNEYLLSIFVKVENFLEIGKSED